MHFFFSNQSVCESVNGDIMAEILVAYSLISINFVAQCKGGWGAVVTDRSRARVITDKWNNFIFLFFKILK